MQIQKRFFNTGEERNKFLKKVKRKNLTKKIKKLCSNPIFDLDF